MSAVEYASGFHTTMQNYPVLAIRVTGELADVTFLPEQGHPGCRCLGGEGLPRHASTMLVFNGCDPADGEETANKFVVPFETACSVAMDFFQKKQMSEAVAWFEL